MYCVMRASVPSLCNVYRHYEIVFALSAMGRCHNNVCENLSAAFKKNAPSQANRCVVLFSA